MPSATPTRSKAAHASVIVMSQSAFWRFSLAFYGRGGVPELCLRVQDEHGFDVNIMLYLLYLAESGRQIDDAELTRIESISRDWREQVVRPLRQVRRALKGGLAPFDTATTEQLRTAVKRAELESEQLQQLALERLAAPASLGKSAADRIACARHNVDVYACRLGARGAQALNAILDHFARAGA
jgi:uncharacterized protein (TIGR02444 family)